MVIYNEAPFIKLSKMASASYVARNMLSLILCSSFFLVVDLTAVASTKIYFAGMFPSWPNKARVPGFILEAGTRLALDHINNDSSILPGYTLDMVTGDSKCDPKVSFNSLVDLLAHPPNILALYGAACSDATQTLAGMTALANVAQVSHTSTSLSLSDAAQYPSLYRAIPTDFPAVQASIALLKMFNWSRVAIIGEKTASGLLESTYNVAVRNMGRNGIDLEWNKVINADQIEQSITEIKEKDVRIIIAAVSSAFGKKLMTQAYVAGLYSPTSVWIWLETYPATWWHDTNMTQHEIMKTLVQYSFSFGDNNNVFDNTTETIAGRTPNEIWREYLRRLKMSSAPSLAAYSYDGTWFLAKGLDNIVKSNGMKLENITTGHETFYDLLLRSLSSVTFTGLTGLFKIYSKDYRERVDGPAHIFQYDRDGSAIEVMTYDVVNNVTILRVNRGYLWKDEKAVPVDREPILSTKIYFAGMFPSWPNKARVPGFVLEAGTRLALDHINNDSSILPGYTLDMVTGDSKCDPKVSFNSLVDLLAHPPNILALYGAACSDATQTLAGMTASASVAQVSHTSTSLSLSDAAQYPSLYRAIPTDFPAVQASIALLKMFNWSRVAIIGEKTASGLLESTYNVAVRNMGRNGIDLEWNKVINADQIEQSIAEIKEKDVRIIIAAVSSAFGKKLMTQAYVAGLYSPTSVWIWLETYPATWWHDTNMTQHEIMKTVVHYSFSFGDNNNVFDNTTETIAGRTPNEIWREYLRRLKMSSAPSLAAYSYDGTWFLAKGLDNIVKSHGMKLENITTGNETFYDLLLRSLSSVTFTGLTGLFKIYSKDYRERLDGPAHIFQYDRDGSAIEVMTYDVVNNVTILRVNRGYLWKDEKAVPVDREPILSTKIYFAGMFPSWPNKARVPGFVLEAGTRLALDHINNDSSILPGYTLDMVTGDSKCDPKVSFNSLVDLLAHPPNILALYGAACSDATQTLAGMTASASVAQVSHTSTSLSLSDAAQYPSLYRAIPTDFPAVQASIALLKMFNWSRVAIIGEKTASGLLESTYNVAVRNMGRNGIDLEWNKVINADQIEQSIAEIKEKDVRIIIAAVSSAFGKKLMTQAYVAGLYSPTSVWIWLETYPATWWHDTNMTQHEIMKTVVHYSFSFGDNNNVFDNTTETIAGRTPNEIWREYLRRLKMSSAPSLAAYSYDGTWFLAKGLDNIVKSHGVKLENITTGNETFYDLLLRSLSSVTFTGLTGLFKIYSKDYRERVDGPAHIFQYDRDGSAIEVMTYDVVNNVTILRVNRGYLWKDEKAVPVDRELILSTKIYFAGMFPSWPNKARVPGFVLEAGTRLALDHINNDSSILPGYTLDMVTGDSKCDPKVSFNSLVDLLAHPPNILALYGAACSDATQTLAGMTASASVAQVSHTSTSLSLSDAAQYPSLYRAIPTDFPAVQASIALLKMFNWSRVAIIGEKTASGLLESAYEVAVRDITRNGIDLEWNNVISTDQIEQSIAEIKDKDIRIILTAVSSAFGKKLMAQAFVAGLYSPKNIWIWLETYPATWWHDTNMTQHEIMKTVVQYSFSFGDNNNVQDNTANTISGHTPNRIWTEYLRRINMSSAPSRAAYSYDGTWFLAKALDSVVKNHGVKLEKIQTGNETFYDLLTATLSSVTFTGLTGLFKIYRNDYRERLDGPAHVFQYDRDGNAIEVMAYDVSNNVTNIKFGHGYLWRANQSIPTDREHEIKIIYEPEKIKEWIFILLTALCALGIFVSFAFVTYQLLTCRRDAGRYAAILNIFITIGCMCLCISGMLYGLRVMDELEDYDEIEMTCLSQLGLTSVGMTLIFGAIISKLLGIIFTFDQEKPVKCTCGVLVIPLLVSIAIDVVLVTLWFKENAPKPSKFFYRDDNSVTSDGLGRSVPYNYFCSETKYPDWAIMIYIFHSVQILIVILVAIATKGKSTRGIDDGAYTRWSVLFSIVLFLGVVLSDVPDRDSLTSLKNSYIIFTSVVSGCTMTIIFCLVLKTCCVSSNDLAARNENVVLKTVKSKNRH